MIEKLRELLSSINDESTLEETRRVILDVIDALDDITKDLDEYQALVDKLTQENADKDYEIARLKEENGRIFRERAESIKKNIEDNVDEITETSTEEIEQELIDNIDI